MFRVKLSPTGQGAWLVIDYVMAVLPGQDLGTSMIVLRDQGRVVVEGIADELGLAIAKMRAGVEPLVDQREPEA